MECGGRWGVVGGGVWREVGYGGRWGMEEVGYGGRWGMEGSCIWMEVGYGERWGAKGCIIIIQNIGTTNFKS